MDYRSVVTTTVLAMSCSALILLLPGCGSSSSATSGGTGGSSIVSGNGGNSFAGGVTGVAKTISGIKYAGTASPSQTLDLLLPGNATLPLPLIIRTHGGAFSTGSASEEETGTAASAILAKGYALAALNYRLSGEAQFPAGAQDVKAAVRWLRAHAADYGLDTAHFASWGESAGAWFAVMLGVTGDQSTVFDDDSLGNPGVSTAVVGVVEWYGPVDFATQDSQQVAHPPASCPTGWLQHTPASSGDSTWMGGALDSAAVSTKVMQSNLVTYVGTAKALPLFIMAHGDDDCVVSWGQAQELNDALAQVNNSANFTILAGYSHVDSRFETTQTAPDLTLLATVLGR